MKKRICLLLAVCLLLTLAACGHGHGAASAPVSEAVQIPNPWRDVTEDEAKALCPASFTVPDGAENARWSVMEAGADPSGVPGALVQLSFDLDGNHFTAREQRTDDRDADISGMYYDWTYRTEETLKTWADGTLACRCFRCVDDSGYADLCAWYDDGPGVACSVSVTAKDLDGFDLLAIAEALSGNAPAAEPTSQTGAFSYVHDPRDNPEAMKDIVVNPDAVYGFSPDPASTRLGSYAGYDWTDPEVVAKAKEDRRAYHESFKSMSDMLDQMQAEGATVEEIARAVSTERNRLRLAAYDNDPEGLAEVKESNLKSFGHEDGPTPDELYAKYGSWEMVLQKAFSANLGMDACCGLYDEYYPLYIELGYADA
ncbi:MAG: hypothetical protein K6F56_04630 [Oscillospiraceae bacterium]|nr:hypothetical protein [Oscillospiraceae bacterium]